MVGSNTARGGDTAQMARRHGHRLSGHRRRFAPSGCCSANASACTHQRCCVQRGCVQPARWVHTCLTHIFCVVQAQRQVLAAGRLVGGDGHHTQRVDLVKLSSSRLGCARHARQLLVEPAGFAGGFRARAGCAVSSRQGQQLLRQSQRQRKQRSSQPKNLSTWTASNRKQQHPCQPPSTLSLHSFIHT